MDQWILPKLPFELPKVAVPEAVDLSTLAEKFRLALSDLQDEHLARSAIWRDSFALTGLPRTFYTRQSVLAAWKDTAATHSPAKFVIDGAPRVVRSPLASWVEICFTFETTGIPATTNYGFMSVILESDGQWRIWILRTILEQLKSQPNVDVLEPVRPHTITNGHNGHANGTTNGANGANGTNGINGTNGVNGNGTHHNGHHERDDSQIHVVIIGGGQAGLAVGGRLKALGVPYVILEKHEQVGDNWRTRYDSTKLHTIREFGHLPFERTFGPSYREFLTKDDLAKGYREWVDKYDINIWLSTSLLSGSWDKTNNTWILNILKKGQQSTIRANHVVFCVGGNSQFPLAPTYENRDAFRGITLHSGEYHNANDWKGKHGVVVGTANTAHDVADDMLQAGLASVTMIQRSPTYVVPAEHYRITHDAVYNERVPITVADRIFFTGAFAMGRVMGSHMLHSKAAQEPERFDALEKAGFKLDRRGDMTYYLLEKLGGHYMDVGTSAKIASGLIKVKSDSLPVRYTEDGLECEDGSHLPADVVVFATGFVGNLRVIVKMLFGDEVGDQVEDYWGLDEEGELRGAFKPCGHPGFWYSGGAVGQARYFSRFIALQIKAMSLGTPLPIYKKTPPREALKLKV